MSEAFLLKAKQAKRPHVSYVWGCASALLLCACASASAPGSRVQADGAVILAEPDPQTGLSFYDPEELFGAAAEAERKGEDPLAKDLYQRLIAEFSRSSWVAPARFNLGLLLEEEEAFGEAAAQYEAIFRLGRERDPKTFLDASFRVAVCRGAQGRWWDAVVAFDRLLEMDHIDAFDRLQALVGRGIALQEAGEPTSADIAFSHALRFYRETAAHQRFQDAGLVAEAAFRMGEIASQRFRGVVLQFPPLEQLTVQLEEKCRLLLSAQHRYLRAIRYGDGHTVAAAGFRIGSLYEALYEDILALGTPPELIVEQSVIYREEVRRRIQVLLEKAIVAYEKSLVVGRRVSTAEPWVAKLETALSRLQAIYLAELGIEPGQAVELKRTQGSERKR